MITEKEILEAYNYQISDEKINFELDGAISVGSKTNYNLETLSLIHSFIDHTSLNSSDNKESIKTFLDKLKSSLRKHEINNVAAVCVFPKYIEQCKDELKDLSIRVACVAGGFPFVQSFKEIRDLECKLAVESNCDEVDIVIPLGEVRANNLSAIKEDLISIRKICKNKLLKVILETGEIKSSENIFIASIIAMESGADFIKTSTGKSAIGATPEAVYVMAYAVKKYYEKTNKKVGIKVAGGIGSTTTAVQYLSIIKLILGEEWLTEKLFRIGTSNLTEKIQKEYIELREKQTKTNN